jgi:hypothetical protein
MKSIKEMGYFGRALEDIGFVGALKSTAGL